MNYRHRSKGTKYAGAKARCASGIVPIINGLLKPGDVFWDCFCGSCKIIGSVRTDCVRVGTDLDPHIIKLLRAVQRGWDPPAVVTEGDYKHWRKMLRKGAHDPMVGFVGYACSFGGKFFAGYARSKNTARTEDYAGEGRRALLRQRPFLRGVILRTQGYETGWEGLCKKRPAVIYCDPPYAGTIPVGSRRSVFDTDAFWAWANAQADGGSAVLVSEYACPVPGVRVVWERRLSGDGGLRTKGKGNVRVEKLFCLSPHGAARVGLGFE